MLGSLPALLNIKRKLLTSLIFSRYYAKAKVVHFTVIDRKGSKIPVKAEVGDYVYDAIFDANISDYGNCGASQLCTTCHVIFKPEDFNKTEDPIGAEERQMLHKTLDVTPTSRLGCQTFITESMEGIVIKLPHRTKDIREEDVSNK